MTSYQIMNYLLIRWISSDMRTLLEEILKSGCEADGQAEIVSSVSLIVSEYALFKRHTTRQNSGTEAPYWD